MLGNLAVTTLSAQPEATPTRSYCIPFVKLLKDTMDLDILFPVRYFDLKRIKAELDGPITKEQINKFMEPGLSNVYKPNSKYYNTYRLFVEDRDREYNSLTNFEASMVLGSDLVIKGRVIAKDNYSDSCLLYKSTYKVLIIEEYKDNFEYEIGDTVVLKSMVGYEGGCAVMPGLERSFTSFTDYEFDLSIGKEMIFGLSSIWYYRVTITNAMEGSPYAEDVCLGSYFVDPGFNLRNCEGKIADVISLLNSVK